MNKETFKERVNAYIIEEIRKTEKAQEHASGYNQAFLDGQRYTLSKLLQLYFI